ncbi:MAG: SDR family NAD(P)-dependent oxidoreductase [Gammaproteobacteria bacterium]
MSNFAPDNDPVFTGNTDLSQQTALITGASSGLGWRFALTLAQAGARVAILGRRADRLQKLRAEIESRGGQALVLVADLANPEQHQQLVNRAIEEMGSISILVNNAGIVEPALATKASLDNFDQSMNINLRAPYFFSCGVANHLIANQQPGRIVNIASIAAKYYPDHGVSLYAISKAAVVRMTEVLATEWARYRINVNAISPGYFASEMTSGAKDRKGAFWEQFPRKRIAAPALLDSTLLYLCAPESEAVTGANIVVDDGQLQR